MIPLLAVQGERRGEDQGELGPEPAQDRPEDRRDRVGEEPGSENRRRFRANEARPSRDDGEVVDPEVAPGSSIAGWPGELRAEDSESWSAVVGPVDQPSQGTSEPSAAA